jgi:uncharacterized protein
MQFSDQFPYLAATLGGLLIGLAALLLMACLGRIAGVSGIAANLLQAAPKAELAWRVAFISGLVVAGFVLRAFQSGTPSVSPSPVLLIAGGLLVGFGSVLGSGCTSGHGVCGLGRLSVRSLVATLIFMAVAAATVFVMRHLLV